MTKRRISAAIDPDLLCTAEAAVKRRRSSNFSAWMSEAIRRQLEHERRLATLGAFLAAFQASQGAITAEEIAERIRLCCSRSEPMRRRAAACPS